MNWDFGNGKKMLIGMVHCLPLPGTYESENSINEVIKRAIKDATCLERLGFDALIVENEDKCTSSHMSKVQMAGLSMVTLAVRNAVKIPVGLCFGCLNYEESLSVAKVSKCDFIRTPIFVDTVMNYNGIINPCSADIIACRKKIGAEDVKILADIQVKHYYMLNKNIDVSVSARWAQNQGADGVIVTGTATGVAASIEDIKKVKNNVSIPVAVGSGITVKNIKEQLTIADILIIGTSLRVNGCVSEPIDVEKAKKLLEASGQFG